MRILVIAGLLAACIEGAAEIDSATAVTRTFRGDTLVVENTGSGAWGSRRALRELVRIGVRSGADEYQFGGVSALAPTAVGGVYVYDRKNATLREYDANGLFVRSIGRVGSGPGEYRDILGMATLADGRLAVWDPRNSRANLYAINGDLDATVHVQMGSVTFASNAFTSDSAGRVYARTKVTGDDALLRIDVAADKIDTVPIAAPPPGLQAGFLQPTVEWAILPSGGLAWGFGGTYEVHVESRGRRVRFGRRVDPVPVEPRERAQYLAVASWTSMRSQGVTTPQVAPVVAETRPYYSRIQVGPDGRYWVLRQVGAEELPPVSLSPARPEAPPRVTWVPMMSYDVFASTGEFLGNVQLPKRTEILVIAGDDLWGVTEDQDGVDFVVRYRLITVPDSPPQ